MVREVIVEPARAICIYYQYFFELDAYACRAEVGFDGPQTKGSDIFAHVGVIPVWRQFFKTTTGQAASCEKPGYLLDGEAFVRTSAQSLRRCFGYTMTEDGADVFSMAILEATISNVIVDFPGDSLKCVTVI